MLSEKSFCLIAGAPMTKKWCFSGSLFSRYHGPRARTRLPAHHPIDGVHQGREVAAAAGSPDSCPAPAPVVGEVAVDFISPYLLLPPPCRLLPAQLVPAAVARVQARHVLAAFLSPAGSQAGPWPVGARRRARCGLPCLAVHAIQAGLPSEVLIEAMCA